MKFKFLLGFLAVIGAGFIVFFLLSGNNSLLTHPKGIIAAGEKHLLAVNISLMLIVAVPLMFLFYFFAWKYRAGNKKAEAEYEPEGHSALMEILFWVFPAAVVAAMAVGTWGATHQLDPYKPIESSAKPVLVQVVAMDWKWLFIYSEEGIASVNFLEIPENIPINFSLTADGAPMNSFWIPQLSGQMYAMDGMITPLHIMANGTGEYTGRAAEINGKGFAGMIFRVKSVSQNDFNDWVASVKNSSSSSTLTQDAYNALVQPSENNPPAFYSSVMNNLYNMVVMKYMAPASSIETMNASDTMPAMNMKM